MLVTQGMPGMLANAEDVGGQGQGGRGCFGVQGLPAGDAGNAEEELGVQQNTVYPTGRVALALRARRHTSQLDLCCS